MYSILHSFIRRRSRHVCRHCSYNFFFMHEQHVQYIMMMMDSVRYRVHIIKMLIVFVRELNLHFRHLILIATVHGYFSQKNMKMIIYHATHITILFDTSELNEEKKEERRRKKPLLDAVVSHVLLRFGVISLHIVCSFQFSQFQIFGWIFYFFFPSFRHF